MREVSLALGVWFRVRGGEHAGDAVEGEDFCECLCTFRVSSMCASSWDGGSGACLTHNCQTGLDKSHALRSRQCRLDAGLRRRNSRSLHLAQDGRLGRIFHVQRELQIILSMTNASKESIVETLMLSHWHWVFLIMVR